MSGIGSSIVSVVATGNPVIDGLLYGAAWSGTITYSFPDATSDYSYQKETTMKFAAATSLQANAAEFALDLSNGNAANNGFSVEGFTNAQIELGPAATANVRLAQSNMPTTAYAYMPGTNMEAGDAWFGGRNNYTAPQAGDYAWHTILHELGHTLGLKHGHEAFNGFAALPTEYDSIEYSIMTYRTYENGPKSGYTYTHWSAPQTYMMADIVALQHIYGANFSVNSDDTTYTWSATSGDTYVNGKLGIDAGGIEIFATIWDGGGNDTYDLRAYTTSLRLDLRPGESSSFSDAQLADLGRKHHASGNIYNAFQYEDDVRSLIENAIGGSGNDRIRGNNADNILSGNGGNDRLNDDIGSDLLRGGLGDDRLFGGVGDDQMRGGRGADALNGGTGNDLLFGGSGSDTFRFSKNGGFDVIEDFHAGIDTISLRGFAMTSFDEILAHAVQAGDDVVIAFDDATVLTLDDFNLKDLHASNFLF